MNEISQLLPDSAVVTPSGKSANDSRFRSVRVRGKHLQTLADEQTIGRIEQLIVDKRSVLES